MSKPESAVEVIGPAAGERVDVLGAPVLLKSGGDPRHMTFADHPLPAGYGVPMHLHEDEDELFYILEGELTVTTEAGEMVAGPGSFVHLPRGCPHAFRNASGRDGRMIVVASPGGGLDGVFRGLDAARGEPLGPGRVAEIVRPHGVRLL